MGVLQIYCPSAYLRYLHGPKVPRCFLQALRRIVTDLINKNSLEELLWNLYFLLLFIIMNFENTLGLAWS